MRRRARCPIAIASGRAAVFAALLAALSAVATVGSAGAAPQGKWAQPAFAIGGYFREFLSADADYALLRQANFTVALEGSNATQCAALGLGCIVPTLPTTAGELPAGVWGYNVGDEPGLYQFPDHAAKFKSIRALRPGALGFANLLETYCPSVSLAANPAAPPGTKLNTSIRYEDYVEMYVETVKPDFLCMDYYPYFESHNHFPFANRLNVNTGGRGVQSMDNYLDNLLILRAAALRHGLTFWNYFGAAAFQGHTAVTEAQLRVQVMASVTTGARGVLYWVIGAGDDSAGWATSPRLGRHWAQARRVNSAVVALGPTLMRLRSDAVVRVFANATPAGATQGAADVVAIVQETLGCSVNTGTDVINGGGTNISDNPMCVGDYRYVRCEGVQNARTPLPVVASTFGFSDPGGWCLGDVLTEQECERLCDALHAGIPAGAPSPSACGSFDWAPSTGLCCLNPPGVFLRPGGAEGGEGGEGGGDAVVHAVKVASAADWTCPTSLPAGTCVANNTNAACAGYSGPGGRAVVGHDFVVSTSTHDDGRRAFTIQNFDLLLSAAPTVVLPGATVNTTAEPGKLPLFEVDPESGREVPAADDVPTLPGLQISLDAAEARVFLVGARP